ncbi:hypothetical protein SAMN05428988_0374 [Chitinophaga sp. YR573]|uniref:hypothetical protein n=1 Tax=Chitinophaga sp. YR573 TaxID=1881040 RepID=UPI0008AF0EF8|nr:hypothetical protein [Chitinophaga sp. YR573]SEV91184.1 hypothetical protein SAMN05428988_0374 [Chitinophaga sp. YR573]
MARLRGGIDFTGKIGGLSAYKRKDIDGTFVRISEGVSSNKIKTAKSFERTRENNLEWKGCGRAAGRIRWALLFVRHLADHNITAEFSKLCKVIQLQDTENVKGQRSILFSKHRDLLEGFRITQKNPFDGVVRLPLKYEIIRETGSAWVQLPNLTPEINLFIPWQYPLFRFVISLQAITDLHYNYPAYTNKDTDTAPAAYTAWQPVGENYTGERIELQLEGGEKRDDSWTFILSVGLEMGTPISNKIVNTMKDAGCARILAVG